MDEQVNSKQDDFLIHEGRTASFLYNKNLAGIVVIKDIFDNELEIDGMDFIDFIAEAYVKPNLIQSIKETPPKDLLLNQLTLLE